MMNIKNYKFLVMPLVISTFVMLTFTACTRSTPEVPITQLETREIQTREYEITDTKLVMKAMMHVLQDDGFVIKNAVLDLGLLSAEKNIDIQNNGEAFIAKLANGAMARWKKLEVEEISANVSEFGEKTRVRVNIQRKIMDNFGCPATVKTVLDAKIYQEFFTKVEKSLFIQQENI